MDQRGLITDPGSVLRLSNAFVNMDLGPHSWTFNTMPHVYYTCIYIAQACSWETTDIPVSFSFHLFGDFFLIVFEQT